MRWMVRWPLPITRLNCFWGTKGRCYSRAEYRRWFAEAGLQPNAG